MTAPISKEHWNFDAFVAAYDEVARHRGGYPFSQERSAEELANLYRLSIEKSIQDFAYQMFLFFQRT